MNSLKHRTLPLSLTMVLTAALLLSVAPPASAGGLGFHFGAGFQIGPVNFHIAFGGHDHHRRGYYYKTSHHLKYRGARCNDRCFRQDRHYYHDTRCPLLSAHFRHYRVHPGAIFEHYAPHYSSQYPGYDNGYYDDDYRHDRYEKRRGRGYYNDDYDDRSYRRHDRYDDRGRYDRRHDRRRHRHDESCGGWRHRSYDD